eukprot:2243042-Heterocapsa_arctica.AAC.1
MALQWWLAHLRHSPPRIIRVGGFGDHVTIFTDGACEQRVSVGAVLFDPRDGAILYFGRVVPEWVAKAWGRDARDDAQ